MILGLFLKKGHILVHIVSISKFDLLLKQAGCECLIV